MLSASAQIAAMETKLASMAKRKPADEDYVPGQRAHSESDTASPMPEGGDNDVEMYEEEELGQEEGERAADDLENEIQADLRDRSMEERVVEEIGAASPANGAGGSVPTDTAIRTSASPSRSLMPTSETRLCPGPRPSVVTAVRRPEDPRARAIAAGASGSNETAIADPASPSRLSILTPERKLPPRPAITTTASPPHEDPKAKAREDAIKRGLAGLPKKPVF